jgi:hypothetical protein
MEAQRSSKESDSKYEPRWMMRSTVGRPDCSDERFWHSGKYRGKAAITVVSPYSTYSVSVVTYREVLLDSECVQGAGHRTGDKTLRGSEVRNEERG